MTPTRLTVPVAAALAVSFALSPALAQTTGLTLSQGDVFSDPVGSVINVSVANGTANTVASVLVTCAFTAGGKSLGSSSTTLYNITPSTTGKERVQMMGVKAEAAACSLSNAAPAAN